MSRFVRRSRAQVGVTASVTCALLVAAGCSADQEPAGDDPAVATSSPTPTNAQDWFAELLEEHRQVDFDPGDEPSNDEAYGALLAEHHVDLSQCSATTGAEGGTCEKPASLEEDLGEAINVQLLLDASGSMADRAAGGTRMQVAQRVLRDFVDTLPDDANVSLRVFGHEGTGSSEDKARSCRSTEQRVPFTRATSRQLAAGIDSVRPAGWTPLARAMDASRRDLAGITTEDASNFVYVLSDGIETCGGDPVAAARRLGRTGVGVDVKIVGFDVDSEASRQLQRAAKAAGGDYASAANADELSDAFGADDWVAWTWYRNCVAIKAQRGFNRAAITANANFTCVATCANREHNAVAIAANEAHNAVAIAANKEQTAIATAANALDIPAEQRAAIHDLARQRAEALHARARETLDYIHAQAEARRAALTSAAEDRRAGAINDATRERDRLIEEAERAMEGSGPDA